MGFGGEVLKTPAECRNWRLFIDGLQRWDIIWYDYLYCLKEQAICALIVCTLPFSVEKNNPYA